MSSSPLYETHSIAIVIALFAFLVLANDLSFRLGRRSRTTIAEYYDGNFRVLKSSLLGLMALLLAFTFSMAAQRHQANQDLVMQESNHLYNMMLESRGLPRPDRDVFLQEMVVYSQARLDFFFAGRDLDKVYAAEVNTKLHHSLMWYRMQNLRETTPQNPAAPKIHEMLKAEWIIFQERVSVFENRVPDAVFILLFLACTLGMTLIGYGSGMAKSREWLGTLAFALLLCSVVYIVQELDRPRRGLFVINQGPMLELKQSIEREIANLPTASP